MGTPTKAAFWLGTAYAALLAGTVSAQTLDHRPILEPGSSVSTAETASAVAAGDPAAQAGSGFELPSLPHAAVTFTDADRLQGAISAHLAETLRNVSPRLPKKEREALQTYYEATNYAPLWVKDGAWTPAANSLIARLKEAAQDGLDAADYPIPAVANAKDAPASHWAEAEIRLSAAAVLYARDARGGRIDPTRLSAYLTPTLNLPAADAVLQHLASASDPNEALASYNPPHAGYEALKKKLAEIREARPAAPMVRVPDGKPLRVGMRDPRVSLIRARFGMEPTGQDETAYDERLASAVAAFQKERGLKASGVLDKDTVAALSGPSPAKLEADLIANMERWRWLPTELGERHILVNIPEFRLRLFENGDMVHQTRVVVGKTESQTPVFSDEMEYVIVNPSWTIPPSIMKNEILPGLARDPYYAARKGYDVIVRNGRITVRQPPGERNALGYVKFIFPNNHSVYLHDTPSRHLFAREQRAFSHGCVRVDQPFRLAEAILKVQGDWSEAKLRGLVGKGERHLRLKDRLPVHLAYFTLAVDETGELKNFNDLYGHNARIREALGLAG
jgi:murein L,D-transpeptidase YcbB/YkuD